MGWIVVCLGLGFTPWLLSGKRSQGGREAETLMPGAASSLDGPRSEVPSAQGIASLLIEIAARLSAGRDPRRAIEATVMPHDPEVGYFLMSHLTDHRVKVEPPVHVSATEREGLLAAARTTRLAHGHGIALATALQACSRGILDAQEAQDQRRIALSGPATTARLLQWLPVAAVLGATILGSDPLGVLLGHPVGRVCLVLGGVSLMTGRFWMRRLLHRAENGQL